MNQCMDGQGKEALQDLEDRRVINLFSENPKLFEKVFCSPGPVPSCHLVCSPHSDLHPCPASQHNHNHNQSQVPALHRICKQRTKLNIMDQVLGFGHLCTHQCAMFASPELTLTLSCMNHWIVV